MRTTDQELVDKARELSQGDIKLWTMCMEMAKWVVEKKFTADPTRDDTDWQKIATQLQAQVVALQGETAIQKELIERAFKLIQDPKARWDLWIGDALSLSKHKKK